MKLKWKITIGLIVLVMIGGGVFAGIRYSKRGIVSVQTGRVVRQDLAATFSRIAPHAEELGSRPLIQGLLMGAQDSANDARRLRARLKETQSFADVVRWQCEQWMQPPK